MRRTAHQRIARAVVTATLLMAVPGHPLARAAKKMIQAAASPTETRWECLALREA